MDCADWSGTTEKVNDAAKGEGCYDIAWMIKIFSPFLMSPFILSIIVDSLCRYTLHMVLALL